MSMADILTLTDPALKPFDWYLALVIAGVVHHGLDAQHLAALRAWNHVTDVDAHRPTRCRTIEAMLAHGITDFGTLLKPASS